MKRIIVASVSTLNPYAKERTYVDCTDKKIIKGINTTDSTTEYFFKHYLNGDKKIDRVFCLVTDESINDGFPKYKEHFAKLALENKVTVKDDLFIAIPFSNDKELLQAVRSIVKEVGNGDEVLIDAGGGFRDSAIALALLYEVFQLLDVKIRSFAIARLKNMNSASEEGSIEELNFDNTYGFIKGMIDFKQNGNSNGIRKCYNKRKNKEKDIESLIEKVGCVEEDILLCKSDSISNDVMELNKTMKKVESISEKDAYAKCIISMIKDKFKIQENDLFDTPHMIKWCLENRKYQEALTLYVERIPEYIVNDLKLFGNDIDPAKAKDKFVAYYADDKSGEHYGRLKELFNNPTRYNINKTNKWNISASHGAKIMADYITIKLLRNKVCHAEQISGNAYVYDVLREYYGKDNSFVQGNEPLGRIKNFIEQALGRIDRA